MCQRTQNSCDNIIFAYFTIFDRLSRTGIHVPLGQRTAVIAIMRSQDFMLLLVWRGAVLRTAPYYPVQEPTGSGAWILDLGVSSESH